MLLYGLHDGLEGFLIEEHNSLKVELRAQQVEKDVLAVTFVQFRTLAGELIEHGEGLGCVRRARHHLPHARLELNDFILQLFVVCF